MRRATYFVMALALALGFTQCKKEQPVTPQSESNGVIITLNVENGDNKHDVITGTGEVDFKNGDVIYVGDGSHYIGTLTRTSETFTGTIDAPANNTEIYFYFVGGLTPSAEPVAGTTTDFTVDISNQTSKLPVLSCNHVTYKNDVASYSCKLKNQCGLVKFNLSTGTDATVNVGGLYTKATIDFDNGVITPGTQGTITLHSGASNTERWAILLPQSGVSATATISGYTCSIEDSFDVANNDYNTTGVSISMTVPVPSIGISKERYSVNSAPSNFISVSEEDAKALADAEMTATGALGYVCIYELEGSEYKWIANDGSTGQNSSIYDIVEGAPWDLVELWYEQGYDDFIWFTVSMTVQEPAIGFSKASWTSVDSAPSNFISVSQATAKASADAEKTATGALGYICIYALEGGEYKWIASDGRTGQNSTISEIAESDDTWNGLGEQWADQGYDDYIWFTVE